MAFLIAIPWLIIAVILLGALTYSYSVERVRPFKPRYQKKH